MSYLLGLRKLVKRDVAKAKTAIAGLLYGDLLLHPATDGQSPRVTGGLNPAGLVRVPVSIAGARFQPWATASSLPLRFWGEQEVSRYGHRK